MECRHIKISDKRNCSGCNACAEICPKACIKMSADDFGCLYPIVDEKLCIECGACVKTCPFINPARPLKPIECYAAVNDILQERILSSSGGVFISLAKRVISEGGVVFGAIFDNNWSVMHSVAQTFEELLPMMGSKYVQSSTNGTFWLAKKYLKAGRKVLFTGTPCQIAGLKHYLKVDYVNLLTVEVICHGVPAPAVWHNYLKENFKNPLHISFRDKRKSWKAFGFALLDSSNKEQYDVFSKNPYLKAFLKNWSLRPSCFNCKAKSGSSLADITLGDFWGVEDYNDLPFDNNGSSCIIVRTDKGNKAIEELETIALTACQYDQIIPSNPAIESSVVLTDRARFFMATFKRLGFNTAFKSTDKLNLLFRIIARIKSFL